MTFEIALLTGLILGFKHTLEPDHMAAVATIRHHYRKYLIVGVLWSAPKVLSLQEDSFPETSLTGGIRGIKPHFWTF